jgi:hypothetical protein
VAFQGPARSGQEGQRLGAKDRQEVDDQLAELGKQCGRVAAR